MKLSEHLIKEGRPLKENLVALLDCLFVSVIRLTEYAKDNKTNQNQNHRHHMMPNSTGEKMIWFPILITIRRLFVTLD